MDEMWLKVEQGRTFWTWSLKCGDREYGGLALSREEAWDYAFRKRAVILGSMRIATWLKSLATRGPLGA